MKDYNMSAEAGAGIALWKLGSIKFVSLGAALLGAGIMTVFRPPKTKKELFMQGLVALGASFLLGPFAVKALDYYVPFIDLAKSSFEEIVQVHVMVHGLLGAAAWGIFGGFAHLRDSFGEDPLGTIKEAKDAINS